MRKLLFLTLFLLMSCQPISSDWFIPPGRNISGWEKTTYCVPSQKVINEYVGKLNDVYSIEIDKNMAINYCGDSFDKNLKPYILRALQINKFTGEYNVQKNGESLWINHNSLASADAKTSKSAIIVFLEKRPKSVFVTDYGDE